MSRLRWLRKIAARPIPVQRVAALNMAIAGRDRTIADPMSALPIATMKPLPNVVQTSPVQSAAVPNSGFVVLDLTIAARNHVSRPAKGRQSVIQELGYGFCGTTQEFCGNRKVTRPSCDDGNSLSRVVGYYEGWATSRPCHAIWPEQIPRGIYTHLNYAFATINPETYEVLAPHPNEVKLMKRLTGLKSNQANLKVNIAIGGWSFNDPGPTASVFSDLAASEDKQRKFFRSLASFMSTYGFDGVDIDWEYPVDVDRGGRPADFVNFPKFMANLKSALQGTSTGAEISLTLPTSYWYLQHFDIKELAKHVDYFNYMSYDLHGTWDKGMLQPYRPYRNKWTGEYLDAHTNLTEITAAMDLLWRNQISPDKVVLGLAFYSRAFTVQSTNCRSPGCLFASGSDAGPCSGQTGVLLNSEIDDIRASKSLNPTLDKDAAVQLLSWDNQWASYDDDATFELKMEFARKTCLGGIMVWAVSHDTFNGTYSRALSGAVPHYQPASFVVVDSSVTPNGLTVYTEEKQRQCKWTNCGQTCTGDYVAVKRSDPGYRGDELMIEGTTCLGGTVHTLCCPKERVPRCGWYTHNNGNCDPTCPRGMFEIGSLTGTLCSKGKYQAACCESGKDSTELYSTLQWSNFPDCAAGKCPVVQDRKTETLALASSGSGDSWCKLTFNDTLQRVKQEERKLCYDSSNKKKTWGNCAWYRSVDSPPAGQPSTFCMNSCPADKVRLATYDTDETCSHGIRAFCCDDNYYTTTGRTNPEMQEFADALKIYLVNGVCPLGSGGPDDQSNTMVMRDILITDWDRASLDGASLVASPIVQRDVDDGYKKLQLLIPILTVLLKTDENSMNAKETLEAGDWNNWAKSNNYLGLELKFLRPYVLGLKIWYDLGAEFVAQNILCRPGAWSAMAKNQNPAMCLGDPCDEGADPDLCRTEELEGNADDSDDPDLTERSVGVLDKRASPKTYRVWCAASGTYVSDLKILPRPYPSAGKWKSTDTQFQRARAYQVRADCANPLVDPMIKTGDFFDTEHVLELQLIPLFFEYATGATLASGKVPNFHPIDCTFFLATTTNGLYSNILRTNSPLYSSDPFQKSSQPAWRIMAALGTKTNKENFYLLEKPVNGMKARIMGNKNLVAANKWATFVHDTTLPGIPLKLIKAAIAVWHYLNDEEVSDSFVEIVSNLRKVFREVDREYNGGTSLFVAAWDEWWHDYMQFQLKRSYDWIHEKISEMREVWEGQPDQNPVKPLVLGSLDQLSGYAFSIVHHDHTIFP
ncbi:hypothetical protein CNMCM6936_007188 [Aspergillus lentulus]|nr:hypothetical protein CNMCM6936_007188 [Aspergillus lentulus]KAF4173439.1 hypothetical protein CNMCM8060_000159 [Aspergillus lentulus]KAF4194228.1 hypothetical protein CNMCM8694_007816 [Aspergillus lentulus]